jgi:hypothetical protein
MSIAEILRAVWRRIRGAPPERAAGVEPETPWPRQVHVPPRPLPPPAPRPMMHVPPRPPAPTEDVRPASVGDDYPTIGAVWPLIVNAPAAAAAPDAPTSGGGGDFGGGGATGDWSPAAEPAPADPPADPPASTND